MTEKIVQEIKVDRKSTLRYKRALISASDDRVSSRLMGVSGILVFIIILTALIIMDLHNLQRALRILSRNLRPMLRKIRNIAKLFE